MSQKSLREQRDQRLRNLEALVERGFEAYPASFHASHSAAELHAAHPEPTPGEAIEAEPVSVAGRVMLLRMLGKLTFATLQDGSGRIQVSFQKEKLERSEEHTSELQSRENLVCRLLLEKKKKKT